MSTHDYHESLSGFSPDQILHDGCAECAERSTRVDHGLSTLDGVNFALAWRRATDWNKSGLRGVSAAEAPLLGMLWSLQVQLERRGVPLGEIPPADAMTKWATR